MFGILILLALAVVGLFSIFRTRGVNLKIAGLKMELEAANEDRSGWGRSFEALTISYFEEREKARDAQANSSMHATLRRRAEDRANVLADTVEVYGNHLIKLRTEYQDMAADKVRALRFGKIRHKIANLEMLENLPAEDVTRFRLVRLPATDTMEKIPRSVDPDCFERTEKPKRSRAKKAS